MEDELTDEQWMTIQPLVPRQTGPGKRRADDRETLDAILYVMSTGCRWESLKRKRYSYHYTAWRRLKRWEEDGTCKRILDSLISNGYSLGIVKMDELSIDSTTVPAKKRGKQVGYDCHRHIKGSKIHAVTTRDGSSSQSWSRSASRVREEGRGGGRGSSTRTPSITCP